MLETKLKYNWLNLDSSKFWLLSELGVTILKDGNNRCPSWIYSAQKRADFHWVYHPVEGGYQFAPRLNLPRLNYSEKVLDLIKSNWCKWTHTRTSGWPLKSSYLLGLIGLIEEDEFSFSKDELYKLLGHSSIPRLIEVLEEVGIGYDEYIVGKRKHCIVRK